VIGCTIWFMAAWRRLWSAISGAPVAQFSESAPRPIDRVIYEMSGLSNRRVSREVALSVPAVKRGRDLVVSISALPLVTRGKDTAIRRSLLLEQIDPDVPNVVTLAQTVEDLLFESIAWWEIVQEDQDGFPLACTRRDPATVSLQPPNNTTRSQAPLPSGQDPRRATIWVDGRAVPATQMIRFDSPNSPILTSGARAIRRAVLLDAAAALYADDPRPADYFTPSDPGIDPGTDEEIEAILTKWRLARKKRSTGYVPAALKYNTVEQPNPRDLQLVELQQQAALDIANVMGLDPEEVGVSTTSRTYHNAVDRRRDRINDVLSPYMRAITDRLSMNDVTRRGTKADFDLDDYMRANPTERVAYYQALHGMGAITTEEIRVEEKLGPLPAGARPAPPKPAAPPAPAPERDVEANSDQLWAELTGTGGAQFNDDAQKLQFADVPVTGFTVDRQRRTIEGLALPYGVTAQKYGLRFQFLKGALKWGSVNRVKLLRDHRMDQPIGVALNLTDTRDGLRVRFKVAKGTAGDDALGLAEDGVLDGLSVGVEFDAGMDAEMNDDGVMLVRRADLREVSLTAMPAFDDARVTKVAASRTEGTGMPEQENEATQPQTTPPAPGGLTLNQDQITALLARPGALDALAQARQPQSQPERPAGALTLSAEQVDALIKNGGMGVLLGLPQVTPAPKPEKEDNEKRATVNPVRLTRDRHVQVHEAMPYRFDRGGNLTRGAQYDFSSDLISGAQGNAEAMERAQKFVETQFNRVMTEFDVDTTDAASLNPNRNRPDMYVDQKEYQYPLWTAINKGTLADSTPFTLPKFSSASGLVAAHTQGVEPTPGAFAATSQTITPSAVSGKVEITREAWDQGGNPQLSGIIWRQMVRAWFEALEASVVTLLDGLSPTGITLTTAGEDSALVGELEAALAALHYVRGGFRMRDFAIQIDLYKKLIDAVDADGRKLLPILGPTNASGTTDAFFGSIMVGGLRGVPAWALAATGTVAASSYLFDRESVHGWATAPNRLGFEYRVAYVDLAIWGYKATACTDLTGVREVIYDPAA
jgi:HK97 family phage prohead protease